MGGQLTAMSDSEALGRGANQDILLDCWRPGDGIGVAEGDVDAEEPAEGKKLNSADDRVRDTVGLCGMG